MQLGDGRLSGEVRWFKKYQGFIIPDAGGDDLFVHGSDVREPIAAGDRVLFEIARFQGRDKCVKVVKVGARAPAPAPTRKLLTKVSALKENSTFHATIFDANGDKKPIFLEDLPPIPVDGNYFDDPLGCEQNLLRALNAALERRGAAALPPSFKGDQEDMANRVARHRSASHSRYEPDGSSFLSTARLLLVGDVFSLRAVCAAARAARGEGAFRRAGLLTRKAAALSDQQGDAFHFLAAVPVNVLTDLLRAQVIKNNAPQQRLPPWAQDARRNMIACIRESGVDLDFSFDIELHGGAFPGTLKKSSDPDIEFVDPATVPSVRWLRDAGDHGPVLEGFWTRDLYVLVGGYDDSDHPKQKYRRDRYELTFPGGKRHLGESGLTCALREVREETLLALQPEPKNYNYTHPAAPGVGLTKVKMRFNYDFGPYHIIASVADANGDHPKLPAWEAPATAAAAAAAPAAAAPDL